MTDLICILKCVARRGKDLLSRCGLGKKWLFPLLMLLPATTYACPTSSEELRDAFERIDGDSNAAITLHELQTFYPKETLEYLQHYMHEHDSNSDTLIRFGEFKLVYPQKCH